MKFLFYFLLSTVIFMLIYSCSPSDESETEGDVECYVKADCPANELCSQDNKCYKPYGESDEDSISTTDQDITETSDEIDTPDPDTTETPDSDINETPDDEIIDTPDPDINDTPDPDINDTPDPDINETPDPDVIEIPDNNNTNPTLIISEYLEGTGYDKAIELYNATVSDVTLDNYKIEIYRNGSTTSGLNVDASKGLTGTLASGKTFVIINNQSDVSAGLKAVMNIEVSNFDFNGDDAVVLKENGTTIDVLGLVGEDPGTAWTVQGIENATKDHKFIRKTGITVGNIDWTINQNEWDITDAISDFSTLGSHTAN